MEQGSLKLILIRDGRQTVDAEIRSTVPAVHRLLCGLTAERVVDTVPRLFSLCRSAQGAAVRLCLTAAQSNEPAALADDAAARPVVIEAIVEHLAHLLVFWPELLRHSARSAQASAFRHWRGRLLAERTARGIAEVTEELAAWVAALTLPAIDGACTACAPEDGAAWLPQMPAAQWATAMHRVDFASPPLLSGQPAETGALARHAGDPEVAALVAAGQRVPARLLARRRELDRLLAVLREASALACADAAPLAAGCAVARVDTARGTLLHYAEVVDERVADYRIIAPTAWNFHPLGTCRRELLGLPAHSRQGAQQAAACVALSLDPCVPFACEVHDA